MIFTTTPSGLPSSAMARMPGSSMRGGGNWAASAATISAGFMKPTGISKAAIEVSNATFGLVLARQNIFSDGVTPADVTFAGTGGGFTDAQSRSAASVLQFRLCSMKC